MSPRDSTTKAPKSTAKSLIELVVTVAVAVGLALLIQAFIGEAIETVAHEGVRDALMFAALRWLGERT